MLDTSIQIKTENFDGPLALLLLLIQKEEMEINNLDLKKITGQYLLYLNKLQEMDFNVAAEYLFLAATLVHLKSKNSIIDPEEQKVIDDIDIKNFEIATQAQLVLRLEELQHFQSMSQKIWNLPRRGEVIFTKPKVNKKAIIDSVLTPLELDLLTEAMMEVLFRNKRKYAIVKKDKISIKATLEEMKKFLQLGDEKSLREIIDHIGKKEKIDVIITFISILELARLGKVSAFQNEETSEIYLRVVSALDNFDVREADGFDEEGEEAPSNEKTEQLSPADDNENMTSIEINDTTTEENNHLDDLLHKKEGPSATTTNLELKIDNNLIQ